jgi:hypothetical protein
MPYIIGLLKLLLSTFSAVAALAGYAIAGLAYFFGFILFVAIFRNIIAPLLMEVVLPAILYSTIALLVLVAIPTAIVAGVAFVTGMIAAAIISHIATGVWNLGVGIANFFSKSTPAPDKADAHFQDELQVGHRSLQGLTRLHPEARPPLLNAEELTQVEEQAKSNPELQETLGQYKQMLNVLDEEESFMMVPYEKPVLLVKEYKAGYNTWKTEPSFLWKCEYDAFKDYSRNPYTNEALAQPTKHKNLLTRYCLFAPKPSSERAKNLTTNEFNELLLGLRSRLQP